jgi:hypothetical protein
LSYLYSCADKKRTKFEPSSIKGIFVSYIETSKAYRIYIPAQHKTVVSQDVKFDEDGWSSKSQPPTKVEKGEKLVVPKVDLQKEKKSDSNQQGSNEGTNASVPSSSIKKPRWLTQTLQEAQEQVGAPKATFRVSNPPKKFPTRVALMTSIHMIKPSSCKEAAEEQVW